MRLAPEKVRGVRDGDVMVGGRAQHEHDVAVEQPQREDRAEALVRLEQHRQGLVGEAARTSEREASLARRERNGGGALVAKIAQQHRQRARVGHSGRTDQRHATSLVESWPHGQFDRGGEGRSELGRRLSPGILGVRETSLRRSKHRGGVAQQVRALPCHGRGRGFESRRSRFQHRTFLIGAVRFSGLLDPPVAQRESSAFASSLSPGRSISFCSSAATICPVLARVRGRPPGIKIIP